MRNPRHIVTFFVFVAFLLGSTSSWAQQELQPDNRYDGYARISLIEWPKVMADLQKCEHYAPKFDNLAEYANTVKIADFRIQQTEECVWMLASEGFRYVVRPRWTKVAIDSQGRDLFDLGAPGEKVICKNPRPISFPLGVVTHSVEVPQPASPPPAEPKRVVVEVPPHTFTQAVANVTINLPTPPPQESRQVEISKGKGFCSSKKCKVLIGALAVGGYTALAYEKCWFPYGYGRIKR